MIEKIQWLPRTILWRMATLVQDSHASAFAFPAHRAEDVIDDAAWSSET